MRREVFLGVLSGTSADGVDIGAVAFEPNIDLLHFETVPFPERLRRRLHALPGGRMTLPELSRLQADLNAAFASAVQASLAAVHAAPSIVAIGFHGQTLWHAPEHGATWQLGDPASLAAHVGLPVIAGFRDSDLALGGQGAPLAPCFHHMLFQDRPRPLAVVNIGGIANVTAIQTHAVQGWDTGPGNGIMDQIAQRYFGRPYDRNGEIARAGKINDELLAQSLKDPFFRRKSPKSTARETFDLDWFARLLSAPLPPEDLMATACELTARTISHALHAIRPREIILCGGGAYNPALKARLAALCSDATLYLPEELPHRGSADSLEAMLFAWLARQRWHRRTVDYTAITGASRPGIYGSVWLP